MRINMTSMERVLCTLGHKEPDSVPVFFLFSFYGAREMGCSVKNYFSKAENIIKTQIYMQEKYDSDCYYTFHYAAIEIQAWGGEVLFSSETPPNAGEGIIRKGSDIDSLEVPQLDNIPEIKQVLEVTRALALKANGKIPVIGIVMSPFSLPVMQMGFEKYLKLIYFDRPRFDRLMRINLQFCLDYANAQLAAGATAIGYFNPLMSTDMIDKSLYLSTGYRVDRQTLSGINGPAAVHFASGRCLPVMDEVIKAGSPIVGIGPGEDLSKLKEQSTGKITLLGNLNGIEMCRWDEETSIDKVKNLVKIAAPGGGFILSDSHGEIPIQVPEDTLLSISKAARVYGRYPLDIKG
ncbi:MAG: uroporphyrinogen decarboxylase family protein [Spirochaetales bacterium]|nr:uroporphyrinogen decarboxylase family protein [Spirochaetales bacterium]